MNNKPLDCIGPIAGIGKIDFRPYNTGALHIEFHSLPMTMIAVNPTIVEEPERPHWLFEHLFDEKAKVK